MDYLYSVNKYHSYEEKIKRSTFIAHVNYVETIEEAKDFITKIATEHKNANHNCWAYILGDKGEIFHSSDAGEPSGTAGKPMFNALQKENMTNIVAVVTRYFGGVKLGIRGLIDAYGGVLQRAIKTAEIKKLVNYSIFSVCVNYDFFESLKYNVIKFGASVDDFEYSDKVQFNIRCETYYSSELRKYLNELNSAGKIEIINVSQ